MAVTSSGLQGEVRAAAQVLERTIMSYQGLKVNSSGTQRSLMANPGVASMSLAPSASSAF